MDFQIDYPMFLLITNRKPGDQGHWTFDAKGIRSTITPGSQSAHDAYMTHQIIEGSRLDFPAMASDLLRVEANLQEAITPDWLREVVACGSTATAEKAVRDAMKDARATYDDRLRRLTAAKTGAFVSRGEKVHAIAWANQEANDAMMALEGLQQVLSVLASARDMSKTVDIGLGSVDQVDKSGAWQKIPVPRGSKPLRVLLVDALNGLEVRPEAATAGSIIGWLLENRPKSVRCKQQLKSRGMAGSQGAFGLGPLPAADQSGDESDKDPPAEVQYRAGKEWKPLTSTAVLKALDSLAQAL